VLKENLEGQQNSPMGDGTNTIDQPGLKDMALKATDILQSRPKNPARVVFHSSDRFCPSRNAY
jgi:hypothetical protein